MSYISVEQAVEVLKDKKPVIIFDAENENEGDVVFPSEIINTDIIKFMMNKCRGVICQTLTADVIEQKQIPVFTKTGQTKTGQTNFIYPVDHIEAHSGISCFDREMTIKAMIDPNSTFEDFVIPGHQNLLKISKNGVLERQGHTESSSDLVALAGYIKSATICEIIDEDGIPMDGPKVQEFSKQHDIPVVLLNDIHAYFLHQNNIKIIPFLSFEKNPFEKLHDKVCVLTGGSKGIGAGIKTLLQKHSCNVIDLSRSSGCDIVNTDDIDAKLTEVDRIDYLINCAGHINTNQVIEQDINDWKQHFDVNVFSAVYLIQKCTPLLKAASRENNSSGVIINICSPSAHKTRYGWSGYCASKAALESVTKHAALELYPYDIRVFGVSPSKTNTDMIHRLFPDVEKENLLDVSDVAKLTINVLVRKDNIKSGEIFSIKKE